MLRDYQTTEREIYLDFPEPHITSFLYHLRKQLYFRKGSHLILKIPNQDNLYLFEAYCRRMRIRENRRNQ